MLTAVTARMHECCDAEPVQIFSAYLEAVARKCREGAPLATYAIDRRSIANYTAAAGDENIFMFTCFSCARRYPHVTCKGEKNEIRWCKPFKEDVQANFLGMSASKCQDIYGLDTYIERYGHQKGFPDMRKNMTEFDDWQLIVPFPSRNVTILCCPEDRECRGKDKSRCMSRKTLCSECELPLCRYCEASLLADHGPFMPEAALTNDLMICYAPNIIYERQVTWMELVCASVCLTTMISFTLEKKYRGSEPRLFDADVHMQRHTIGTRGNATSFPMPWEEILRTLQGIEGTSGEPCNVDLPNTGDKLCHWVQVLLKTSGATYRHKEYNK